MREVGSSSRNGRRRASTEKGLGKNEVEQISAAGRLSSCSGLSLGQGQQGGSKTSVQQRKAVRRAEERQGRRRGRNAGGFQGKNGSYWSGPTFVQTLWNGLADWKL